MKKLIFCLFFGLFTCAYASADPIKVTLSNGETVILESTDFANMMELMSYIQKLEDSISKNLEGQVRQA